MGDASMPFYPRDHRVPLAALLYVMRAWQVRGETYAWEECDDSLPNAVVALAVVVVAASSSN